MKHLSLRLALAAILLTGALHAQVPKLINYQGRVAVDTVNFEGAGLFKFALVNEDGSVTFWSNDGISVAGSEPTDAVSLTVAKGLYSVLLGDIALANMSAIPTSVFTNPDVRLRVWFDDGVNASQLLTPDQRLAPSPYLADGAVTSASIADDAITNAKIAPATIDGTRIAPASLDFSHLTVLAAPIPGQVLGFDGASLNWMAPGGVIGGDSVFSLNGTNAYYSAGNVGIGTATPEAKFDVRGSMVLEAGGSPGLYTGTGNVELNRYLVLINSPTFQSATGLKAGGVLVSDSYSYANPTKNNLVVKGSVGIGTPTPGAKLTVQTPSGSVFAAYGIEHTDGTVRLTTYIDGSAGWFGTRSNHPLNFFYNDGVPSMTIGGGGISMVSSSGFFTVGSPNAESGASIQRGGNRGDIRFDGTTLKLVAGPGNGPPGSLSGIAVHRSGNVGIGTTNPSRLLDVAGDATMRDLSVRVLTIRGGADLAEPFAMSHRDVAPGMVVVIDEGNPGKLRRSAAAYDKKVAGIVSGANGIRPGISMIQEDILEAGENVALSGRVYVKANASGGAIEPGDLLTTSDVPGEAMKAADPARAQGAILGKAMTGLPKGEGSVLVLVTLQ